MPIYLSRISQDHGSDEPIFTALQQNKAFDKIPAEYFDYFNIFLTNLAIDLPKNIGLNKYVIKLIKKKQPLNRSINIFSLMELDILKTNIKTYSNTDII